MGVVVGLGLWLLISSSELCPATDVISVPLLQEWCVAKRAEKVTLRVAIGLSISYTHTYTAHT